MPRFHRIAAVFLILSLSLTGCSLSLPPPTPQQLLAVFTQPFTCGFSFCDAAADPSLKPRQASLVRTQTEECLTVFGDTVNAVFVRSGTTVLQVRSTPDLPLLSLPLPDDWNAGALACFALFSVLPDDTFTSVRGDGGILVTNADASYSAVFSEDGIPARITYGTQSVVITSFTQGTQTP